MAAGANERKALQLAPGATVFRIRRLRSMADVPFLTDHMSFAAARFEHFAWPLAHAPMSVYQYLEREFGMIISYVQEQLRVVPLNASEARLLQQPAETAALEVLRVAIDLGGAPVEYRRSVALTSRAVYLSELRSRR